MRTKRSLRMLTLTSLCAVFLCSPGAIFGRTIYVDDDASGVQDGSSWASAFPYLQDALVVASAGDEIRVAQGLYRPDQADQVVEGKRAATFLLVDGVAILGGFAGVGAADPDLRDPARFATILSGDLAGDDDTGNPLARYNNSFYVVMAPGVGSDTVLDGLTICHGYAADRHGAGMYNGGGSPLLRHCTFRDNLASDGDAGVYNDKGNLRIEHCRFLRNSGEDSGALCNHQGSVVVIASEFIENYSSESAAGVYNEEGDMVLFGCLLRDNRSDDGTGAVSNRGDLRLLHCTFVDNDGGESVGAMQCRRGNAVIANCLFVGNTGDDIGAMSVQDASASLHHCTFYGNVATDGGPGAVNCRRPFWTTISSVHASECIFWGNRGLGDDPGDPPIVGYAAQIGGDPNRMTIEYCCIEGWTPEYGGTGNIGDDPLFVGPDAGDFHLKSQAGHWDAVLQGWLADDVTSPCIDAGDPLIAVEHELFPNGGIVNMGVYGGTCEASKSWFGTEPCPTVNAADINGDCRVDAEDYRLIVLRWLQPAIGP